MGECLHIQQETHIWVPGYEINVVKKKANVLLKLHVAPMDCLQHVSFM